MNYELALKLKKAGFPEGYKGDTENTIGLPGKERIFLPTLSELIEACGKDLATLNNWGDRWSASTQYCMECGTYQGCKNLDVDGKTPEIAVANLWLKLNKK